MVLLHIIDGGGVDLSLSVYRVIEREQLISNDASQMERTEF